jgi:hypothetical protein
MLLLQESHFAPIHPQRQPNMYSYKRVAYILEIELEWWDDDEGVNHRL